MKSNSKKNVKFVYDEKGNKIGVLLNRNDYDKLMNDLDEYDDYKLITSIKKYKKSTASLGQSCGK